MGHSLPASSVSGFLQARTREWVAISFSRRSSGDLPHPGIEPRSPALQVDSLPLSHQGSPGLPSGPIDVLTGGGAGWGSLALPPAGPQGKGELTLTLVLLPGFSGKPSLAHTRPVLCLHWLFQTGVKALISEGFLVRLRTAFVQKKKKKSSRDLRKWMNGMFYVPVLNLKTILQMQKVIRI